MRPRPLPAAVSAASSAPSARATGAATPPASARGGGGRWWRRCGRAPETRAPPRAPRRPEGRCTTTARRCQSQGTQRAGTQAQRGRKERTAPLLHKTCSTTPCRGDCPSRRKGQQNQSHPCRTEPRQRSKHRRANSRCSTLLRRSPQVCCHTRLWRGSSRLERLPSRAGSQPGSRRTTTRRPLQATGWIRPLLSAPGCGCQGTLKHTAASSLAPPGETRRSSRRTRGTTRAGKTPRLRRSRGSALALGPASASRVPMSGLHKEQR